MATKKKHSKLKLRIWRRLPDRAYIQWRHYERFRKFAHLRRPVTYNEKLHWLKLNYRVPGEWRLVDKVEVKEIVAEKIGARYVIPTLRVYDNPEDIDFDELPESFVLKCTHDSGRVVRVRDKSSLNAPRVVARLRANLARQYFYVAREPHYREIPPRILAEPYFEDAAVGQLLDYKFFCFDGEVKAMYVASDRASGKVKFDYFDADFNPLHIRQPYPNAAVLPTKPSTYEEMLDIARTLSAGHPHVRIDLYEVNGRVYFGEYTFYSLAGLQPFHPAEWDEIFGSWLHLPAPTRKR